MAENQQDQDRTEEATPFKLREAKRRGQVSKSLEVNSLLMLTLLLMMIYLLAETMITNELYISQAIFSQAANTTLDINQAVSLFEQIMDSLFTVFWPLVLGVVVVGVLSNMFQTGPVFSFFPLKPDVQRINPVSGFKRLFSTKLLFEAFKSVLKLVLFGTVIYFFMAGALPNLLSTLDINPDNYPHFLLNETKELMAKMLLVLLVLAILDAMFTRWEFSKKMRMSRRDVKEEVKRRDGDPLVRAKQRELQKEAAKRAGSLSKVSEADVLITNPTHLSVALYYERGVMSSPEVIAKGAGELALKMRQVAKRNNVPIVENKRLARALFKKVEIANPIPETYFASVAKILVWVFAQRKGQKGHLATQA